MKRFATAALAVSLIAGAGVAQTPAQLMQKGIYDQQTAGDLDAAIQVYRQLVASPDRAVAGEAQFRLTETLLAKGDLTAAGEEFGKLAHAFADLPNLVKTMEARARALSDGGIPQLLGSFRDSRYHHNLSGTEMTVPSDWSFRKQEAHTDGGDAVYFGYPGPHTSAFLWIAQEDTPSANLAQRLRERFDRKLALQRKDSDTIQGFRLRPEGAQTRLIGGRQALFALGDYSVPPAPAKSAEGLTTVMNGGEWMTEYQVFIQTEKLKIFFSGRTGTAGFTAMQPRFDQMLNSIVIPQ